MPFCYYPHSIITLDHYTQPPHSTTTPNHHLSLQGFLNTCVYVYSNRTMMKWLRGNLICVRIILRPRFISHTTPSTRLSIDKHVESGFRTEGQNNTHTDADADANADAGSGSAQNSTTDSELDDLEDDTEWLRSANFTLPRSHTRPTDADPNQVLNVLVQGRGEGNTEDSLSSKSLGGSRKSILIGEKNIKNIDSKSKRNSAHYYPDVDSEKFVRFGK